VSVPERHTVEPRPRRARRRDHVSVVDCHGPVAVACFRQWTRRTAEVAKSTRHGSGLAVWGFARQPGPSRTAGRSDALSGDSARRELDRCRHLCDRTATHDSPSTGHTSDLHGVKSTRWPYTPASRFLSRCGTRGTPPVKQRRYTASDAGVRTSRARAIDTVAVCFSAGWTRDPTTGQASFGTGRGTCSGNLSVRGDLITSGALRSQHGT
jgi:hypothetical protein